VADSVASAKTALPPGEVTVRAIQFFTGEKWRPGAQSERIATFQGRPSIGCVVPVLTVLAFLFFIIPGVIMYFIVVRRAMQFQNLVVTASPVEGGTYVTVTYPGYARKLVTRFLSLLPPADEQSPAEANE
jgi:hypothetical protein